MKQKATQSPDPLEVYFKERFRKKNLGVLEGANLTADDRTCRGGRDHIFFYLRIKEEKIEDISFECGGCDMAMFVAGDILCDLVRNKRLDEIENISEKEFIKALGGKSKEGLKHFKMAMKVLNDGIKGYPNHIDNGMCL
ncbi:MAG: iron-sulfur cluster assembly scaffold protein [bacterium]